MGSCGVLAAVRLKNGISPAFRAAGLACFCAGSRQNLLEGTRMSLLAAWSTLNTVLVILAVIIVIVLIVMVSTRKGKEEGKPEESKPEEKTK